MRSGVNGHWQNQDIRKNPKDTSGHSRQHSTLGLRSLHSYTRTEIGPSEKVHQDQNLAQIIKN